MRTRVQQLFGYSAGHILYFTEPEALRIKIGCVVILNNLIYISDQKFEEKNI